MSGQYLHGDEDSQLPIRVDVETVGVPEDCGILSTEVRQLSVKVNQVRIMGQRGYLRALTGICEFHLSYIRIRGFKPLNPKSDLHQISPCIINAL